MRRAGLLALLLLASCSRHETQHPNVLLITLDTFRADRIGASTPNLSRLARSGIWYRQADSAAPLTLPSHATILSGLLPLHHGLRNNGVGKFPQRDTLATVFSSAGYRTGAFVSAFVLDRRFGLSRGFDTYDDAIARDPNDTSTTFDAERRGADTVDRALAWLLRPDSRPWFAWIHLYDAHAPYAPPSPFPQTYDGEVAYVDAQAGRILNAIDRSKTIVVVVGDHGESLGEHDELTHGLLVYESTLHVPLIVAATKGHAREDNQPIGTAAIASMLAELAGVPFTQHDREIYSESEYAKSFGWSGLTAIRNGNIKLIRGATSEMFDLSRDPNETTNIINDQRRLYGELARRLDTLATTATASTGTVDEETRAKLASLGYIAPRNAKPSNRDPRAMAPLFRRYEEAQAENSIRDLEQIVAADPANPVFRSTLARAHKLAGSLDRAIALYREAVAIAPADPDGWYNLATALEEIGRADEAKKVATEGVRLDPNRPDAHNVLGVALIETGDATGAESEFRRAIARDPRNARAYNNLGNVLRMTGRLRDADAAYHKALEITPNYADSLNGLGVIAVQDGRTPEAIDFFDKALAIAPDFYEAQLNRAIALQVSGNVAAARAELQRLIARLPRGHRSDTQRDAARTLLSRLPRAR
ncbi:MAG: sulfatase-like hydrolase/transferase [Acidobacteriota bacterium]|nr:sulfatase-like hydrolase/transferase [Acidobacteriota bacterium]